MLYEETRQVSHEAPQRLVVPQFEALTAAWRRAASFLFGNSQRHGANSMPLFRFSGSPFPPPDRRVFTAIVPLPEAAENLPQKGQGTFGSSAKNLFGVCKRFGGKAEYIPGVKEIHVIFKKSTKKYTILSIRRRH